MIPTLVIGLREGVEASLIVVVTFMIVWMARHSRGLKKELEGAAAHAITGLVLVLVAAGLLATGCTTSNQAPAGSTAAAGAPSQDPAVKAALDQAVQGYQRYVVAAVDKLVPAAKKLTDAVRAGDLEGAKQLYAPARWYYEEIEPVAESFGDLDPAIDVRADNVTDPSQWTGFHRLEKALWADRSLAGMAVVADRLDADLASLKAKVATATYQPAQLANGATELLNEVASNKITGEEDRYSHTDLSDFAANIVGAKKAFDLLVPALGKLDPQLAGAITQRFADVQDALKPYQQGSGYVDYSTVGDDKRRVLTQKVDALAEPLSQVAAKVAG